MQGTYNALTNTTDCVDTEEVISRVQHAKAPLLRTGIDQGRIFSAIASTNTVVAGVKQAAAHPHAAILNLSAAQQGKRTAADLQKIKAAAANPHADTVHVAAAQAVKKAQRGVDVLTVVTQAVDERVQTLESGLLVSDRAYSTNTEGGFALQVTPATDAVEGGHASFQTFDGSALVTAGIELGSTGVSITPALALPDIADVGAYITETKADLEALKIQNAVEEAANAAIEVCTQGIVLT